MQTNLYRAEEAALFSSRQSKLNSVKLLVQHPADFSASEAYNSASLSHSPAALGQ